ncbi:MAG: hypothetical protein A3F18_04885 [Legionellales bacterium RIFCSPHIGHO2_12_FULL_37_14]|nr:MAG: hypothetical protein A3F18_04885 [Legionellales bacterium RIFCSPHIGHO2_12_FULL_37_14]
MQNPQTSTQLAASDLIQKLNLEKHIEGGAFRRVYESKYKVAGNNANNERQIASAIYYLLEGNDFSAFHRLKSDEIWAYNYGSPLTLYVIDKNGALKEIILGDPQNPTYQVTISANEWFAAEINDKSSFTLISCFVAPGFDYNDFELANQQMLINEYPEHANLIKRLTK